VTQVFHLLTGEFPPDQGGVGDYTNLLARTLAARGCLVHVWCPSMVGSGHENGVQLHRLPDWFGPLSRRALESAFAADPGCVLLQYVPNALGVRGVNLPFCIWLRGLRRRTVDVRVMFHECYFYFAWQHPRLNVLAAIQRVMARVLLQASSAAYLSTEAWVRYLRPFAPRGTRMILAPIPSTVGVEADPDAISRWRARFVSRAAQGRTEIVDTSRPSVVGHFGTFGDHLSRELSEVVPRILHADPMARFVCIGRGSETFAALISRSHPDLTGRVRASGALAPAEVPAALRACDIVVQPYPDGVTTRRTSVMAGLASGVATVTTDGALTEPVWAATAAVALVPAGDAGAIAAAAVALLQDADARVALGEAGRRAYDTHFALDRTVDVLLAGKRDKGQGTREKEKGQGNRKK
jgi:glycosyltransferase involved in cell wall biosynthesis